MDSGFSNVVHTHNHSEAAELYGRNVAERKTVIITGVREPLSRCISAYFQNISDSSNRWWYVGEKEFVMDRSIDWLVDDFNKKSPSHVDAVVRPWFEQYVNSVDLPLTDFEKVSSYWKAQRDNVAFYLYKLETLSEVLNDILAEPYFERVRFRNENEGEQKWYGEKYKDFKKAYRITRTSYEKIYGNIDYVRFFYRKHDLQKSLGDMLSD